MLRHVGVVLLLLLGSSSGSKRQHEDVLQSFLHDLDVNQDANDIEADAESDFTVELYYKPKNDDQVKPLRSPSKGTKSDDSVSGEPVSRLWGVPDTTATVGTLFSMAVPKDAFQGDVQHYQLKGLPSWLHWDGHRHMLEGVARPSDRGHHYITIKAVGADGAKAKDVFSVDVTERSSAEISRAAGCSHKVDLTLASIVIDKSVAAMDAKTRVRTIRAVSKFLGVKRVSLTSTVQDLDPLADDAAILIGPGSSSHSGHGEMSQIQWVVGCGGEISSSYQGTVDRVEVTAKDGTLEQAINVPVLGWTVVQVHAKTRRVRRQTDYSSGDYGIDYDNLDYGLDDWNLNYDDLVYDDEEDVGDDEYDEYEGDYGGLATPVLPDVTSATPYPAPDSRRDYASMKPVLISTPVYVPVKPTRVVTSIEASPTIARPPVSSAYYPDLESSITTKPVETVKTTVPLKTSTTTEFSDAGIILPDHVTEMVYTETEVKNFSPEVSKHIPKITWIAGHVYRYKIPENTFKDMEDGFTRDLILDLKNVGYASWIQFDSHNQEIYALPLYDNIGDHVFYLEAMDKDGKSSMDPIHIHVKQAKVAKNTNHKITTQFKLVKKADYGFQQQLDWQVKAVEKIAALYGEETASNINILSIFDKPHRITWTDVSLVDPHSQSCPGEQIKDLVQVLVKDDNDMEPNAKAKRAFEPEFVIKKVNVEYVGNCMSYEPDQVVIDVKKTLAAVDEDTLEAVSEPPANMAPIFKNPVKYLNATQGLLFIKKLEVDTCYDLEDGDINNLKMRLLTDDPSPVPPKNWLHFDPEKKEFYGIPLQSDVGKRNYILECSDEGGKKVNDELTVNVKGRSESEEPAVEFQIVIQHMSYDNFMSKSPLKKLLLEKIAEAFKDTTDNVVVKSFTHGSVIATWYNSSLASEHHGSCPSDEIKDISEKMLDDNGDLLPSFKTALQPFDVTRGSVKSLGRCLGVYIPSHKPLEKIAAVEEDEGDDYLLNFIIPAIIITIMLLLAAIIACCLYRRRRYGKMDMTDDHTFVSKGIPIIFAEELDDRQDPAKSPMLMKDEKQPLPPPEYTRGNTLPASTPPNGERMRPQSGDQSPYQPPPPFTATNGASRNQRPNMTPTYRKPPTYVPP